MTLTFTQGRNCISNWTTKINCAIIFTLLAFKLSMTIDLKGNIPRNFHPGWIWNVLPSFCYHISAWCWRSWRSQCDILISDSSLLSNFFLSGFGNSCLLACAQQVWYLVSFLYDCVCACQNNDNNTAKCGHRVTQPRNTTWNYMDDKTDYGRTSMQLWRH